jgi:hypothetical protein
VTQISANRPNWRREHPVARSTCAPTQGGPRRLAEERFRQTNPAVLQGLPELPGA